MFEMVIIFILIGIMSNFFDLWIALQMVMSWAFVYYVFWFLVTFSFWIVIFKNTARIIYKKEGAGKNKFILSIATVYSFWILSSKICVPFLCFIVGTYVLSVLPFFDIVKIIYSCTLIFLGCVLDFLQKETVIHVRKTDH